MNYFEFYDIPISFCPDQAAIRKVYLSNSRKYHPDFHTLADEAQQLNMLELSTFNNDAFKTLSDADLCMRYVLKEKNVLPEEAATPPLAQSFLMEMMDINEAIMDLEFEPNADKYQEALAAVFHIEKTLEAEVNPIRQNWHENVPDAAEKLEKIKNYYFKKKYLLRIRENLFTFASAFEK